MHVSEDDRRKAAQGVLAVRGMLDEWQALRAELRAIEVAEHPALTDKFGRVWTWTCHDCYHHDNTLALTRDMIGRLASLPPERLRGNPNYWQLCEICRSQWADRSPVFPRVRLNAGWYDVRDGQVYAERDEDQAAIDRWEADGGA